MNRILQLFNRVMVCAVIIATGVMNAFATEPGTRQSTGEEHVVEITRFKFVPETIEANPGDTITWVNRDIAPHTATSKDGDWDIGTLNQNESKSLTVSENMTSPYYCRFHRSMTALVAVSN